MRADAGRAINENSPLLAEELRALQQRSDAKGLARLAIHLAAMGASGGLYGLSLQRGAPLPVTLLLAVAYGFTFVTMFAAMHESVHRTAFKTRSLNDAVGWFAGLLSFYNSSFFRHYHGYHHRFTQLQGQDPELDDVRPTDLFNYLLVLSGLLWWIGKLKTHFTVAAGRTQGFAFLNEKTGPKVVRSVRLQLLVYAAAIALSIAALEPLFVTYWLLPVATAQPLLRAILLAEHTGCSENDDALSNTRTTYTVLPVRLLMWDMPYHAEHHRYPALPFFSLSSVHKGLGPQLVHVSKSGYLAVHLALVKELLRRPQAERNS